MRGRRAIMTGGATLAAGYAIYRVSLNVFSPRIEFEPLSDPRGFRRIAGGDISAGFAPFVGISAVEVSDPLTERADSMLDADICGALFGSIRPDDSAVRIASFSDYHCPYCPVQPKRLARI